MRIRTIKPQFFKNDEVAALDPLTRLLFIGLWCMADIEGRLEDRPARIKAEVLPYDNADVEAMLAKLAEAKFIFRYEGSGFRVIEIASFKTHQRFNGYETKTVSRFPAREEVTKKRKKAATQQQPSSTEAAPQTPGTERNGTEGNGVGAEAPPPAASAPPDPYVGIPGILRTEEFLKAWTEWQSVRRQSRSRPKTPWDVFFARQLDYLAKFNSADAATESINQSLRNGWQGLFEPKGSARPGGGGRYNYGVDPADKLDPEFRKAF